MQIDHPQPRVGGFISRGKAYGQGERVEPRTAARPGSMPAGFHLTPRNSNSPRAVAARLTRQCQSAVAIGLKSSVKRSYCLPLRVRMIDETLPKRRKLNRCCGCYVWQRSLRKRTPSPRGEEGWGEGVR